MGRHARNVVPLDSSSRRHGYVRIHDYEARVLDAMDAWICRLFMVLVRCTDYRTGKGSTGYAELVRRCTPLQPARGPRLWAPSLREVKDAVRALEARGLVRRDHAHSTAAGVLLFELDPRVASVRPRRKLRPLTPTPLTPGESVETPTPNSDPSFKRPLSIKKEGDLSTSGASFFVLDGDGNRREMTPDERAALYPPRPAPARETRPSRWVLAARKALKPRPGNPSK